jgi:hypothetical protein
MELFILKSGSNYIKILDAGYSRCGLDKASVFPLEKIETVRRHKEIILEKKLYEVNIYKLVLSEVPFE